MKQDLFIQKRTGLDKLVQEWFAQSGVLIKGERVVPRNSKTGKITYVVEVEKCSHAEAAFIRWQSLRPADDMDGALAIPLRLITLPVFDYSEIYQAITLGILLRTKISEYSSYDLKKKRQLAALTDFVKKVRKELGVDIPPIGHKEQQTVCAASLQQNFRRMANCFCADSVKAITTGFESEFPTVGSLTLATRTEVQECLMRHHHNAAIHEWDDELIAALGCFDLILQKAGLCFKPS